MSIPICGMLWAMASGEQHEHEPGVPLTAKGRATRARILDIAAELILERGVAGTGIEDVRKAAGVSGSQMTHYFRDKQTLVHEVICFQAQATLANAETNLVKTTSQHNQAKLGLARNLGIVDTQYATYLHGN